MARSIPRAQPDTQLTIINTERTPKELATLCLNTAMNETGFVLDGLPDLVRPTVMWDYENPANALQALCDDLGCRIFLGLDNKVHIKCKAGVGEALPTDGILRPSFTIDPPDMPDTIAVACAGTRHQLDLQLESVALDNPINGDPTLPTLVGLPGQPTTVTGPLIRGINGVKYAVNSKRPQQPGRLHRRRYQLGILALGGQE